jgi:hypothetical protein
MAGLSERKMEIVRTLVETSPDKVVGALQAALAQTGGDTALAGVRRLVEAEAQDRRLRNAVLQPIAPLCVGDGAGGDRMTFPARVLALTWRGLKAEASNDMAAAVVPVDPGQEPPTEAFDRLAARAAEGLRGREGRDFRAAAELCDQARPDGAELFCKCLDLAPVVRQAVTRLSDWISRTTDENTAGARLAYKDAVVVADDAGPRFFEMLAGQLAEPWMILRIISAVMDKPTEKYLAECELAGFAERLMDDIDRRLKAVAELDLDGGAAAGKAAGQVVEVVTHQIMELEETVELSREGVWGARVAKQKKALAATVEASLRAVEKAAAAALPTHSARFAKLFRTVPKLDVDPDPKLVGRAVTLLTFAEEIRSAASQGGFASTRAKVIEKLGETIDQYVEEVLDRLRADEVENREAALLHLAVAADFNRLIRGEKAAEIVRRRAAAASAVPEPASASDR